MSFECNIPAKTHPGRVTAASILSLCLFASLIIPALNIKRNGLWIDELFTFHAVSLPFWEMCIERLKHGHSPFFFAIVKGVTSAFGPISSEIPLRMTALLSWYCATISFFFLSLKFLSRRHALFAITLLTLGQTEIRWACIARMYTMLLFEMTWVIFAYLRIIDGSKSKAWKLIYVVGSVLAAFTSPSYFLVFPAFLWDSLRRRKTMPALWKLTILAPAFVLITILPVQLFFSAAEHKSNVGQKKLSLLLTNALTVFLGINKGSGFGEGRFAALHYAGLVILSAAAITFVSVRKHLTSIEALTLKLTLVPLVIMLLSHILAKISGWPVSALGPDRYLFAAFPAGSLLTASAFARWTANRSRTMFAAEIVLISVYVICAILIFRTDADPFRTFMKKLSTRYSPADGLIVYPEEVAHGVKLYVPGARIDAAFNRGLSDPQSALNAMKKLNSLNRVWLVWYQGRKDLLDDLAAKAFGPGIIRMKSGDSVRVIEYHPRKGNP
jgi:hypothetical protein